MTVGGTINKISPTKNAMPISHAFGRKTPVSFIGRKPKKYAIAAAIIINPIADNNQPFKMLFHINLCLRRDGPARTYYRNSIVICSSLSNAVCIFLNSISKASRDCRTPNSPFTIPVFKPGNRQPSVSSGMFPGCILTPL